MPRPEPAGGGDAMRSWRMDLAVLTDLASSMFAASFMILLIFLSLVQRAAQPVATPAQPVEAASAFHIVQRKVLSADRVIALLRLHARPGPGLSVSLFADRVEVTDGRGTRVFAPGRFAQRFGGSRSARPDGGGVRLYVFSNRYYNQTVSSLGGDASRIAEVSVPSALRDRTEPDRHWSRAFLRLAARGLDEKAFRSQLAALLNGGSGSRSTGGQAGQNSVPAGLHGRLPPGAGTDLLARLIRWIGLFATWSPPIAGLLASLWIERRRLWPVPQPSR